MLKFAVGRSPGTLLGPVLIALSLLGSPASRALADSLCAPTDDPCVVDSPVLVEKDEAVELKLGRRALHILGAGRIILPDGGAIECGELVVQKGNGVAIDARKGSNGDERRNRVSIAVQNACSLRETHSCKQDADCSLGTCSRQLCRDHPGRSCAVDSDCVSGPCDLRACLQLDGQALRECSLDTDCFDGTCSLLAPGTIDFHGDVLGAGYEGADLGVSATAGITFDGTINVNTHSEGDAADVSISNETGDIDFSGSIYNNFKDTDRGGEIDIDAAGDLFVDARISSSSSGGHNASGGEVRFYAANDLSLRGWIRAHSRGGGGDGGDVYASAGRDLLLDQLRVSTKAGAWAQYRGYDPGSGGAQRYSADRDVVVTKRSRLKSTGGSEYSYGGEVEFDAGRDVRFSGDADVTCSWFECSAGYAEFNAARDLVLTRDAVVRATAKSIEYHGGVDLNSGRDMRIEGRTQSGESYMVAAEHLDVSGSVVTRAYGCDIRACSAAITSRGKVVGQGDSLTVQVGTTFEVQRKARLLAPDILLVDGYRYQGSIHLTLPTPGAFLADGRVGPDPEIVIQSLPGICPGP